MVLQLQLVTVVMMLTVTTSSRTDVTLSQSIGGGASIFAEFQNLTGAGVAAEGNSTSESVVAVGTSVSF